jgi:hypothetical protein
MLIEEINSGGIAEARATFFLNDTSASQCMVFSSWLKHFKARNCATTDINLTELGIQ